MDYIKIRLSADLDQYSSGLEKTVEEMFQSLNPLFTLSERPWKPQMDVYETRKEIIVLAEVSGIDKNDLDIEISARAIKIAGDRKFSFSEANTRYCLAEIQYGTFERILILPAPVNTDKVSASCSNGLLQIRMVKWFTNETHKIEID